MVQIEKQTDCNMLIDMYCRPLDPLAAEIKPLIRRLKNIRAVICDIYGTLFISASGEIGLAQPETRKSVLRTVLSQAGVLPGDAKPEHSSADLLAREIKTVHQRLAQQGEEYPEVDIIDVWKAVLDRLGARYDTVLVKKIALAYELQTNPVWPMPGLSEVLSRLNHNNILLGIVSNAQFYTPLLFKGLLHQDLKELGFKPDLTVFSYMYLCAKPSPRLFRVLLTPLKNHYALDPSQVLYLGNDVLNDILPARECGFKTALFAGDSRSLRLHIDMHACVNVRPDVILTDLKQLLRVIPLKV